MFDVNGQLFFPTVGINPEHPYWIPEFLGDTICVNGKVWPFLNVQAKRYRFLIINGSNARPYELFLNPGTTGTGRPAIWQIGTDGGYLDAPVAGRTASWCSCPANAPTSSWTSPASAAQTPDPDEHGPGALSGRHDPSTGNTSGRIMQFRVAAGVVADTSYNPATRYADPDRDPDDRAAGQSPTGTLAPGVTVAQTPADDAERSHGNEGEDRQGQVPRRAARDPGQQHEVERRAVGRRHPTGLHAG